MEPGAKCEIVVQYMPTKVEKNFANLLVERTNFESFKKTVSAYFYLFSIFITFIL